MMRRVLLLAAVTTVVAGCSRDASEMEPEGAATVENTAAKAPVPAAQRTFRAWDAACDNTNSCTLFGFPAEGSNGEDWGFVRIDRAAGPEAEPVVTLAAGATGGDGPAAAALEASIDGGRPFRVQAQGGEGPYLSGELRGAEARAFVAALRNGVRVRLTSAGATPGVVSLDGAAAALLWADERQGRVGTTTALARGGDKPASAVPPAPNPPVVTAVKTGGEPVAWKGSDARVAQCLSEMPEGYTAEVTGHRLTPELVLWEVPCGAGAYNVTTLFFYGDAAGGGLRPAVLSEYAGEGDEPANGAINAGYDPATGRIEAFAKGRGIGDCGSEQSWAWDGRGFVLVHERSMGRCEGVWVDHWPVLHRAVVR